MARAQTDPRAKQTADSASTPLAQQQASPIVENDIARRAYDRYLARGCEPGHALDDWLDAERELQQAAGSVTASVIGDGLELSQIRVRDEDEA